MPDNAGCSSIRLSRILKEDEDRVSQTQTHSFYGEEVTVTRIMGVGRVIGDLWAVHLE